MFNKKFLPYLIFGILGLIISLVYVTTINPEENFLIANLSLSPIPFLFFLLFVSVASLGVYTLKNLRRGILVGVFLEGVLLLRLFDFNNILYPILLFIILALVEFLFFSKK